MIFTVNMLKEGITIVNAFETILNESKFKPDKICVEKGGKFYNILMKS